MHVDFFANDLAEGEGLAFADKISPAQFFWRDSDRCRHAIQVTLECEDALRRTKTAESAVGRGIGGHGAAANADVEALVRSSGMDGSTREDDRRKRLVGAAVDGEIDVHGQQFAFARDGGSM